MNDDLMTQVSSVDWYHTIDLGNGIATPGHYDHRQYIEQYGIPDQLSGKAVLDIGAGSGFFSFEFERRGAVVTATDLPEWFAHDFGPCYQPDRTVESGDLYLHQPFEIARRALGSRVQRKTINIYGLSPETIGTFDLVFCASVLLHLTDPLQALWNIARVTREKAIIATALETQEPDRPIATMVGFQRGDAWWLPTRTCLEMMVISAGFVGIEWIGEFRLDFRDGGPGLPHGVLHAYPADRGWSAKTLHRDEIIRRLSTSRPNVAEMQREIERLRVLVQEYERNPLARLRRSLNRWISGK